MAEKKYVLAIDQSTHGTKGILFDAEGRLICRRDIAHEQIVNEKGWVSHDLDEIYRNTLQVVQDVVTEAGIAKEEIACLGISNQRETSAAWDRKTKEPLAETVRSQSGHRIWPFVCSSDMESDQSSHGRLTIVYS